MAEPTAEPTEAPTATPTEEPTEEPTAGGGTDNEVALTATAIAQTSAAVAFTATAMAQTTIPLALTATADAANQTATSIAWAPTTVPTSAVVVRLFPAASYTFTPSVTPTPAATLTFTPTPTFTATPTLSIVTQNSDWESIEHTVDGVVMVYVPRGCFTMGSGTIRHTQCIESPFWIGKYEVTNAEFEEFVRAGGYNESDYWTIEGWSWRSANNISGPSSRGNRNAIGPDQPVAGVSWYEAYAYARWRGWQLPTDAQWEYAARGPSNLRYPWGNSYISTRVHRGSILKDVGSYPAGASWVGALDMIGNASEWTSSQSRAYPYDASDGREAAGSSFGRSVRGGSVISIPESAWRQASAPATRSLTIGFRVAMPAD